MDQEKKYIEREVIGRTVGRLRRDYKLTDGEIKKAMNQIYNKYDYVGNMDVDDLISEMDLSYEKLH